MRRCRERQKCDAPCHLALRTLCTVDTVQNREPQPHEVATSPSHDNTKDYLLGGHVQGSTLAHLHSILLEKEDISLQHHERNPLDGLPTKV